MTTDTHDSKRLLAEIGLSEQEEQAYRLLLARGTLATEDVSDALELTEAQSARILASLEHKALIGFVPGTKPQFRARSPELAIEALILQKQASLERTRSAIALLERESDQEPQPENIVEVITGPSSLLRVRDHLQRSVRQELRCLIPPPFMDAGVGVKMPRTPSIRYMSVIDSTAISDHTLERVCAPALPSECRLTENVPARLMIADRCLALLPLDAHNPNSPALLVRPSSLLDGLIALFEMIWRQATPVEFAVAGGDEPTFSPEIESLIPLIAAGMHDKEIAHRMGISLRTLIRRVTKLLAALGARSRFQAGWAAAMRHYGISTPKVAHSLPDSERAGGNESLQRRAH